MFEETCRVKHFNIKLYLLMDTEDKMLWMTNVDEKEKQAGQNYHEHGYYKTTHMTFKWKSIVPILIKHRRQHTNRRKKKLGRLANFRVQFSPLEP